MTRSPESLLFAGPDPGLITKQPQFNFNKATTWGKSNSTHEYQPRRKTGTGPRKWAQNSNSAYSETLNQEVITDRQNPRRSKACYFWDARERILGETRAAVDDTQSLADFLQQASYKFSAPRELRPHRPEPTHFGEPFPAVIR